MHGTENDCDAANFESMQAFAFVLEDSEGVCGYTLAALDTRAFNTKVV